MGKMANCLMIRLFRRLSGFSIIPERARVREDSPRRKSSGGRPCFLQNGGKSQFFSCQKGFQDKRVTGFADLRIIGQIADVHGLLPELLGEFNALVFFERGFLEWLFKSNEDREKGEIRCDGLDRLPDLRQEKSALSLPDLPGRSDDNSFWRDRSRIGVVPDRRGEMLVPGLLQKNKSDPRFNSEKGFLRIGNG